MIAPLANDEKGYAFELPNEARAWRVIRATGQKGKQQVLRFEGRPLEIPIDAEVPEFCERVEKAGYNVIPGRFRLQAVDSDGRACCDTIAVLEFDEFDESAEPRNASIGDAGPQFRGELQEILRTMKEGHENAIKAMRELVETARRRDDDTLRTLRESLKVASETNGLALKALAKRVSGLDPVIETVQPDELPEAEAAPEATLAEKFQQIMEALPQIMNAVDAIQKMRNAAPAAAQPSTPSSDTNGTNGAGGFGIHPPPGNGSNGSNGGHG